MHHYNSETDYVGFPPTRQAVLPASAKRREVVGKSREGWGEFRPISMLTVNAAIPNGPLVKVYKDHTTTFGPSKKARAPEYERTAPPPLMAGGRI